jgi:hypothetical protein
MKPYLKSIKQDANLSSAGTMETGNHSKNGVNLQNLSSRENFRLGKNTMKLGKLILLVSFIIFFAGCKKYDKTFDYHEGLAKVGKGYIYGDEYEKYGYIDENGNIIIPVKYKIAHDFEKGRALVANEDYKYGFIDKTGNEIVACKYSKLYPYINEYAKYETENASGIIDINGNEIPVKEYSKYRSSFYYLSDWELNDMPFMNYGGIISISKDENNLIDISIVQVSPGGGITEEVGNSFFNGFQMTGHTVEKGSFRDAKFGKYECKSQDFKLSSKYNESMTGQYYAFMDGDYMIMIVYRYKDYDEIKECINIIESSFNIK